MRKPKANKTPPVQEKVPAEAFVFSGVLRIHGK